MDVALDGSYGLVVQKDGFLATTEGINVNTTMQSLGRGLFSMEGFFILKISGSGVVFASSYGAFQAIDLGQGEQVIVNNGA